ncbi:MAG TPA: maleylpyruvate isomerase family mycothiol-dependent enzyme [Streptosporangiaceae bacterium]
MDQDQVWQAIDTQRSTVARLLESLHDSDWERPSLCADWTVRDVAAHLTLQQVGPLDAVRMMVTAPGGMKRTIRESARKQAAKLSAAQIVAEIGGMVGSRRHNVGVTYQETLIDILVHSQDISWPLGGELSVPPQAASVAMARVWNSGWPFRAKKRLRGLQLSATDSAWSAGDGPEIRGTSGVLLLLLTGRQAALPLLAGDGIAVLRERLAAGAR